MQNYIIELIPFKWVPHHGEGDHGLSKTSTVRDGNKTKQVSNSYLISSTSSGRENILGTILCSLWLDLMVSFFIEESREDRSRKCESQVVVPT